MLKRIYIVFVLFLFSFRCFSQVSDSVFKNELGAGIIWTNSLTTSQIERIPYLAYKKKINKLKLTSHILYASNYNHGHTAMMVGGGLGISKSSYPWKNKKWELFYGIETLFIYEEILANNRYKYFESIWGICFPLGLSHDFSKHLSLSTQISPAFCYDSFRTFKFETNVPGVNRELNNYTPKKFTKGFLRFLSLECNYKF